MKKEIDWDEVFEKQWKCSECDFKGTITEVIKHKEEHKEKLTNKKTMKDLNQEFDERFKDKIKS